jgi:hypothetical protein
VPNVSSANRDIKETSSLYHFSKANVQVALDVITPASPFQPSVCMTSFESLEKVLAKLWSSENVGESLGESLETDRNDQSLEDA